MEMALDFEMQPPSSFKKIGITTTCLLAFRIEIINL